MPIGPVFKLDALSVLPCGGPNKDIEFMIPYTKPGTAQVLVERDQFLENAETGERVAPIVNGIPRFVPESNYADSFGWQWKKWENARSDQRNPGHSLRKCILERTHFDEMDIAGKTLLECGMGGGDDTEILVQLPFSEIHSFDMSTSVERAQKFLGHYPHLRICQASIFDIPYAENAFDVVFCHRVLMHTPDPPEALKRICRKVKPGGILFAHSYKRSWRYMNEWRHKYRWLTRRLPVESVYYYVENWGPAMEQIVQRMYKYRLTRYFAFCLLPWYYLKHEDYPELSKAQMLEMAQHITFDALTPWHDKPMTPRRFRSIIESEGFDIKYWWESQVSPMFCTAIKRPAAAIRA